MTAVFDEVQLVPGKEVDADMDSEEHSQDTWRKTTQSSRRHHHIPLPSTPSSKHQPSHILLPAPSPVPLITLSTPRNLTVPLSQPNRSPSVLEFIKPSVVHRKSAPGATCKEFSYQHCSIRPSSITQPAPKALIDHGRGLDCQIELEPVCL